MIVKLLASLAAVLILAWLVRALRLGEARIESEAQAREEAEAAFPGFVPERVVLASDGRAALVFGGGAVIALKLHGAHVAARRLSPAQVRASAEGWLVETGERRFGNLLVRR